jgi:hypothetical protein
VKSGPEIVFEMESATIKHVEEGNGSCPRCSSCLSYNPILSSSTMDPLNDAICGFAVSLTEDEKCLLKMGPPGLSIIEGGLTLTDCENADDFGIQPTTIAVEAGECAVQDGNIRDVTTNNVDTSTSALVMGFSALDVIMFSAAVTNNFMNREAFFYMDLVICVAFSIFNATVTNPMKAFTFYIDGASAINVIFLWYFCYCRYLNGKDVITLRRSIQLLSHSFQISLTGLLVLCSENHDFIVDDNHSHNQFHHVEFHCTGTFVASNTLRILWHFAVLIKSVLMMNISAIS